ncbi:MAG: GspE/PulE family protein [Pseudomonadota bacterium]
MIALTEQKKTGKLLGQSLVELGFVSEAIMRDMISEITGGSSVDLSTVLPDSDALAMISKATAQRYSVLPVSYDPNEGLLLLAMTDTSDVMLLDRVRAGVPQGVDVEPMLATEAEIEQSIDSFYGYEMSVDGILREIETGEVDYQSLEGGDSEYSQPMVRLVDSILTDAVKRDASDIHFEPESGFLRLRYRIDGVMQQIRSLHKDYWAAMAVRLKVMANLNIAESRSPQDGRISLKVAGRLVDFRVSVQPTTYGENVVLRVLDRARGIVPLEDYKLHDDTLAQLKLLMSRPEGIILVTGPTGSGKTTTLYSMLAFRRSIEVNIMTLEDPVEYPMDLVRQTSIGEASKMTFASGIRSLMRQDPDIILVGEVRDAETAEMAFRAAMTGHQVFTTLHTNSALGAIPRLSDIGVKPDIMSGNIIGVIGQRLVRALCPHCKSPRQTEEYEQVILGISEPATVYDAVGCEHCNGLGYRGRRLVIEVLSVDEGFNELIGEGATLGQLEAHARASGFRNMADDGVRLILDGITTVEELSRVVDLTKRLR